MAPSCQRKEEKNEKEKEHSAWGWLLATLAGAGRSAAHERACLAG
jgi:hypothetical protein